MLAGMSFYEIAWFFIVYSLIGWIVEVMFHAVTLGKVINRGFLNGPVCPVYGSGMIFVLGLGNIAAQKSGGIFSMTGENAVSIFGLFIGGMIITTLVELIAGAALDMLFHTRWWDYSKCPMNYHGYICMEFSLIWGAGVVLAIRAVHPLIRNFTSALVPEKYGWPILAVMYIGFVVDTIVTISVVIGINKKLEELDRIRASMRVFSDELSDRVGKPTITAAQTIQESQVQAALAKAELRDAYSERKKEAEAKGITLSAELRAEAGARASELRAEAGARASELRAEAELRASELRAEAGTRAEAIRAYLTKRHSISGRMLRAFPELQHRKYNDIIEELRARITRDKK